MQELSVFAGIDPLFFKNYLAQKHNESYVVKNPYIHKYYLTLLTNIRKQTHSYFFHRYLKYSRKQFDKLYLRANTQPIKKIALLNTTNKQLIEYYQESTIQLEQQIGQATPWKQFIEARH